jgi:prostaglandin-endoperoxide synthase 2
MAEMPASKAKPHEARTPKAFLVDQVLNGPLTPLCEPRWLHRHVNRSLINGAVNYLPGRPYRLSTMGDYTSWESLTDRTYSAREFDGPSEPSRHEPGLKHVLALFRRDAFVPSEKSTVFFAYVAQWFTDGFLRSPRLDAAGNLLSPRDVSRNDSTHHVDLSQVYGTTPQVTERLRDGRYLRFQDLNGQCPPPLAEIPELPTIGAKDPRANHDELLAMGSDAANTQIGFAMLNTLFLRVHNWLADRIAAAHPQLSDRRVFDATRNVLIVLTIKLVLEEYINHITPWRFRFRFDPEGFEAVRWHRQNWVAVEFNLLYRWHCLIPPKLVVHGQERALSETLFRTRSLLAEGRGLAGLIDDASRQHAGAIELFNTGPELLARGECPTILAARRIGLGTYNDYREHCGLSRVAAFADLSSSQRVVEALERVYRTVDDVEFYPGLFAEDRPHGSVVPPLMGRMVAVHAFSQLLTNPLLAPAVFNARTFTDTGLELIESIGSIQQVVDAIGLDCQARLTHADWRM